MESRFAHLRQRDASVSMLRVKMSRRRSQSQKENRERAVNTRRQLDKLPELEMSSLDASIMLANMSTIQEKALDNARPAKTKAQEERVKQLERWKERKVLEREKEKREKERKGVFKTGLYQPKDTLTVVLLPAVPPASNRPKEKKVNTAITQSTRVTRSMKQQQEVHKPLKMQDPNSRTNKVQPAVEKSTRTCVAPVRPAAAATKSKVCAVEPAVRASSTRSANRLPVTKAPAMKDKPKDVRPIRTIVVVNPLAPPSDGLRNCKAAGSNPVHPKEPEVTEAEKTPCPPSPTSCPEEQDMVVDQAPEQPVPSGDAALPSFAPDGFTFQAPAGLSSFKFEPLTPRSADAFLTPSSSFNLPPGPICSVEPQTKPSQPSPPKTPHCSPCAGPALTKHDVPYFRSEIDKETDKLTTLSLHWESKVEDESIPEEMRDRMRSAVGQARLLMKERFNQFSGLVDDCELGRGEKITTCTDLQGFWDMVYYQVEDVKKKFDALKEAEGRGWVEEHKPPSRQRKVVKKPTAAPTNPTGTRAAAKSRLAAVKAAMKARQQAATLERETKDAENVETGASSQEPQPQSGAQTLERVVFDGGFFQVESPAKSTIRRSSRLSAAVLPRASPCTTYVSPRRVTRQSLALAQTMVALASPAQSVHTPVRLHLTLEQTPAPKSRGATPQLPQNQEGAVNGSLCFSPVKEVLTDEIQSERSSTQQLERASSQDNTAAEDIHNDLSLPPRLSFAPCKTPSPVLQTPEPSAAMSFMLSPCVTPGQPAISSPARQVHMEAQEFVCHTQNASVIEEIPGLDFERYLQPSQRCSLSPSETVARESLSPMATDVEMESPRSQSEELLTQQEPALSVESSVLAPQSPQVQTAESALLLFTPDLKDRIRQSVCPNDLMFFTPPDI
ncbi:disks large-associated protein 5 isoform X2 [Melanotaenia boesemani]|uniref:disks large-associated protein 5 isoform X2 n=1 Tax=Melanotaenia boesemani TaxID=1250792 RepID=UPI001C047FFC|nr:disks large-associated protein 5 isoform X2 [Melanotaenia boesemani]